MHIDIPVNIFSKNSLIEIDRVYKTRRPYRSPTRHTLLCLKPQYKNPQLDRDKTKL